MHSLVVEESMWLLFTSGPLSYRKFISASDQKPFAFGWQVNYCKIFRRKVHRRPYLISPSCCGQKNRAVLATGARQTCRRESTGDPDV